MSELDELKRLLFGDEQRSLNELEQRVEDPVTRAGDVAGVLADSVRLSAQSGDDLQRALREPVDACIRTSIREDVDVFADALFPVMGPAIRRSVLETFRTLVQGLNQTIESAFSWQGIKWRIESRRTGVPVSELVLRDTLEYRVEQVLLIQHDSGLLMRHATRPDFASNDSDAVSAMLTAIQDFVRDSFGGAGEPGSGLDVIEIGEHVVWLLPGPAATLAVVFRGTPRLALRSHFAAVAEDLQRHHGAALASFAGDSETLAALDPMLRECLDVESRTGIATGERGGLSPAFKITLAVLGTALLVYLVLSVRAALQREALAAALEAEPGIVVTAVEEDGGRLVVRGLADPLARSMDEVAAAEGYEPDEVSLAFEPYHSAEPALLERRARRILRAPESVELTIEGTRIRLAGHAGEDWLRGLDPRLFNVLGFDEVDLDGLESLDERAHRLLEAPDSVTFRIEGGTLHARGTAPPAWIATLAERATALAGVERVDDGALRADPAAIAAYWHERLAAPSGVSVAFADGTLTLAGSAPLAWVESVRARLPLDGRFVERVDFSGLGSAEAAEHGALLARLDGTRFEFSEDTTLSANSRAAFEAFLGDLARAVALGERLGVAPPMLRLIGYSDALGAVGYNARLRERRAQALAALARAALPAAVEIAAQGAAAADNAAQRPLRRGATAHVEARP